MTATKTTRQIYMQWQRIFRALMRRGKRQAAQVHPETGGNGLIVHNWGNEAAKAAWAQTDARVEEVRAVYEATYNRAEHREHSAKGHRPMWCRYCGQ